mgnify:CR=1 FL=1
MQEEYKPAAIYSPISIGNWIISLILTMIPIVNIIMLFVWAFSNGTNPTKANWAKAALILILDHPGNYLRRIFYANVLRELSDILKRLQLDRRQA